MAFTLPPLPYAHDALEPAIDKETMTFHHGKHHQTYVDNLNKAVDADASLQGKSLEELFASISTAPKAVRNNGGGHWNHALFWELLAPAGQGGQPSAELAAAIDRDLGGLDAFKEAFNAAGRTVDIVVFFCTFIGVSWAFAGAQFVANAAFNNLGRAKLSSWFNWGKATLGTIPFALVGAEVGGPEGILAGTAIGAVIFGIASVATAYRIVRKSEAGAVK
jgi:hypothetical protein